MGLIIKGCQKMAWLDDRDALFLSSQIGHDKWRENLALNPSEAFSS